MVENILIEIKTLLWNVVKNHRLIRILQTMYNNIEIYAGDKAAEIIREKGLNENNIKAIVGASGGPKFLVLSGFDRTVLSSWFKKRKEPLYFIGSSIGAWRGAAFATGSPVKSLEGLTESYLKQQYTETPSAKDVTIESMKILDGFLSNDDIDFIINRSPVNLNIISAQCRGLSSSDNKASLALSLLPAAILNIASRELLLKIYSRTLFNDGRNDPPFSRIFKKNNIVKLTPENFKQALLSSGSIPFVMQGIKNIPGAPSGTYRDGGLTDYHINIDFGIDDGIVLFPHFSSKVIPGWLDKTIPWRRADKKLFSNTVLVAPSKSFIENLPYGKIPDRKDFTTFFGRDKERLEYWHEVIQKSSIIGDEFMEAASSGKIKNIMKKF